MNPIYNTNEEDNISFYCSTLTDSKGDRSFIYVLNMYDKYKDNTNNNNVYIRIPLHLCVISRINDTDAFKMLLNEAYLIITGEYSFNAKKAELLNYFMFISSIVTPPRHSLLTLNLKYMNIDFYFHSKRELPSTVTDTNMNILFSVLDVSKIIKLWICVLQERQIIIYGSRPFLLHAVIDAITKLIFPFKYPYLIISCLPSNNLDLLDVPTIYIMGVLSSCISIQQLQEKFSETCIVDLETGRIVVKKVRRLPREDEIFLKKRIQFAKNPELFKDVVGSSNDDNVVDMNVTFSKNIQRIFFHLIKQTFKSYKEYIKVGVNKLDEKKYVKAMDEDKGEFWEKILKSAIVDLFINENDDCSNRNHFDELCKCGTNTSMRVKDVDSSFKIKLTCPTINKNKIVNALKDIGVTNEYIDELIQALDAYHNEHGESNNSSFTEGDDKDETTLHLTFNEHHNSTNINDNVVNSEYPMLINSFKDTNFVNTIPNKQVHVDDKDIFYFYDEEKGFINFINKYVSLLSQSKLQLIDIFFQKDFIKELYEQSLMFLDTLSLSGNAGIAEEKENDNEDTLLPSEQCHRPFKSNRKLSSVYTKKSFATISPIKHKLSLTNLKSPLLRQEMFHLIKLTNTLNNKMQKLLFYAFYLEEIYFNNDNTINTKYTFLPDKKAFIDHIINMYHKAITYDKIDFPYERYTFILSKLSTDKLNTLNSNINPVPTELKSYYNEALENSFAKLRVSLHPKMHFHKEQESSLSPVKKRSCFIKSKSPNVVFEGGSNKLVDFARAAIQLKKDLKKEARTLKKNRSKQDILLNSTSSSGMRSSGGATPFDLDKYIDSPKKTSEFSFTTTISNSPSTQQQQQQQPQSLYRFGIATNFTKPIVLNQHKMKYKTLNPLSLIIEIGNNIVSLIDTLKQNKTALYKVNELIEYKSALDKIKKLIDNLQFMNLTKFTKAREKYCFWLNAFNFLVVYAIIYTGFQPQTFEQWDNMLFNCKFDIGRYKYSLYEIVVCFLKCYNFHQSEIVVDLFLQKFLINENNVLMNFCVYLPIKEDFFELKVYKEEIFEEQTFQTALEFFKNNLKYDDELEEMVVSRYLERVFPMILEEEYKTFKLYIDKAVYERLEHKQYQSWRLREINWDVVDYTEE